MVIDAKDAITGRLHFEPPIAKRIALLWSICHMLATVLLNGFAPRVAPNRRSEGGAGIFGQAGTYRRPILNNSERIIACRLALRGDYGIANAGRLVSYFAGHLTRQYLPALLPVF